MNRLAAAVTRRHEAFADPKLQDVLDQIELRYYDDPARIEPIAFPEASYVAGLGDNPEWAVSTLRLSYESMVSPASVLDYDVAAQTLTTLKVQEIPSGYDAALYATERLEIAARDGTKIPVSVVYRKDRQAGIDQRQEPDGKSFGHSVPPIRSCAVTTASAISAR